VIIRHGGPRPRRCADGGIRGVVDNCCGSQSLLIKVTVHLTPTRSVVCKSVDNTHGFQRYMHVTRHARCAIVEPTATMRVQNYACSGIKRGSCWQCSSAGTRAMCALLLARIHIVYGARVVTVFGVCRCRRLSSVTLPAGGPAGRRARGRSGRLHGGPVKLRPVTATPCLYTSRTTFQLIQSVARVSCSR